MRSSDTAIIMFIGFYTQCCIYISNHNEMNNLYGSYIMYNTVQIVRHIIFKVFECPQSKAQDILNGPLFITDKS